MNTIQNAPERAEQLANAIEHGAPYDEGEVVSVMRDVSAEAKRYRAFFDSGFPICFMGQEFRSKTSLDQAIDAHIAQAAAA